jgi:peptidoglycan hydrolase CwlO-like protein
MHNSWNATNSALQQRISETRVAKENLQGHLEKTNQEISDQEKEINTLTKALRDKEAPLKVRYNFIFILEKKCNI